MSDIKIREGKPGDAKPVLDLLPVLGYEVPAERSSAFLDAFNAAHPDTRAGLFHLFIFAAVKALAARPRQVRELVSSEMCPRFISCTGSRTAVRLRYRSDLSLAMYLSPPEALCPAILS